MEWITFIESFVWLGLAATGFAVLFNVSIRTLWVIFAMGALGGSLKILTIHFGAGIILASFLGAVLVGFLSILAAHSKHSPPFVFAIPAVIPMVPGAYAYRMMLGLIRISGEIDHSVFLQLWEQTIDNGLKAFFVLMALALGVSAPMLISRRESAKDIKVPRKIDELLKKDHN